MTELNSAARAVLAQREFEACEANLERAEASKSDLKVQAATRDLEAASRVRFARIREAQEDGAMSERSLATAMGIEAVDLI